MIGYDALPRVVPGCGPQLRDLNRGRNYTDDVCTFLAGMTAEASSAGAVSAMVFMETATHVIYRSTGTPDADRRSGRLLNLLLMNTRQ